MCRKICKNCYYGDPFWSEDDEVHYINAKEMVKIAFKLSEPNINGRRIVLEDFEDKYRGCILTKNINKKNSKCNCGKFSKIRTISNND